MRNLLQINEKDNVAVALSEIKKGETVEISGGNIRTLENIPRGHKVAVSDINEGDVIVKYGFPIGRAYKKILCGEFVHTHNMRTNLDISSANYVFDKNACNDTKRIKNLQKITFKGYRRFDGRVGIRNELWVIPTVGCINGTAEEIVKKFRNSTSKIYADDIKILAHPYGCSQLGDDLSKTRKLLADFTRHPNVGGVLVISLGCENNTLDGFKEVMGKYDEDRIRFLKAQDSGDEVENGAKLLCELNKKIGSDCKERFPFSKLCVGVKCGGSDGLSGITANPLIGMFTDALTSCGGSVIQTEVPEMFGAEAVLMGRSRDKAVFNKIVNLIQDFKDYYIKSGQPVYENPSPGNKAGGITTLEEKSLGCVQKSGTSQVEDVLDYADQIKSSGLSLLCAPGNDLVSSTALAAAGCTMVLFSTGRGTPYGTVVPTIKISTNTPLYDAKRKWIDFNAGKIIEGSKKEDVLYELIGFVQKVADGFKTYNEKNHFGSIAIWKNGVTL